MKNSYYVEHNEVFIELRRKDGNNLWTKVSLNKLEKLQGLNCRWCAGYDSTIDGFYVKSSGWNSDGSKWSRSLHRFLTDAPEGLQVDHKNGDTLDNTDNNLRIVDQSTNQHNRKAPSTNKSGVKGVCWYKKYRKWRVQCRDNMGKVKHIGYYTDLSDAKKAYEEANRKYRMLDGKGAIKGLGL